METPSKSLLMIKPNSHNLLSNYAHIIVYSPHYDDAFLSLGGYLGHPDAIKRTTIVIIFGNSNYVSSKYNGFSKDLDISKLRMTEELNNVKKINSELIVFAFKEALLRGHKFNSRGEFRYPTTSVPLDFVCLKKIRMTITEYMRKFSCKTLHIFPLGIGKHIDHYLVSKIGIEMYNQTKHEIGFYEDQPYAAFHGIDSIILKRNIKKVILPANIHFKINAINEYKSQAASNWTNKIIDYMKNEEDNETYNENIWL